MNTVLPNNQVLDPDDLIETYEVTYTVKVKSRVRAVEKYDAIQMAIQGYGEVVEKVTTLKRAKVVK